MIMTMNPLSNELVTRPRNKSDHGETGVLARPVRASSEGGTNHSVAPLVTTAGIAQIHGQRVAFGVRAGKRRHVWI
jgi:hypothetical protein